MKKTAFRNDRIMRRSIRSVILLTGLFILLLFVNRILYLRMGAFGCFDECPNYAVGYFLNQGRRLYTDIFFNHQMLLPYISFLLQKIVTPLSIYDIVRMHRVFVIAFSLAMDGLLILRFGVPAFGFVALYEATKYYAHGQAFLGESLVVYPLVYLLGIAWKSVRNVRVHPYDLIASAVAAWFVVFTREPYVPVALVLYLTVVWYARRQRYIRSSIGVFIILSAVLLSTVQLKAFIENVISVNLAVLLPQETRTLGLSGWGIAKPFIYPLLLIFTGGGWNIHRIVQALLSFAFLVFLVPIALRTPLRALFLLVVLGLAGLRMVPPGTIYYEAFHMLPWYALLIMATSLLARDLWYRVKERKMLFPFVGFLAVIFFVALGPKSFLWERIDTRSEFATGYARYSLYSEAIRSLSTPHDTLFLELWDDILYPSTGLTPSYRYAWYIPVMIHDPVFVSERARMFQVAAPDFYYYSCEEHEPDPPLPQYVRSEYVHMLHNGKPSCLLIHQRKISTVSEEQLKAAEKLGFTLPKSKSVL